MSEMEIIAEVRDVREPGFFIIDNEVIDDLLPQIGIGPFTLYCALVRWSIQGNATITSVKLEKMTGAARSSIYRWMDVLTSEEVRLIERIPRTHPDGSPATPLLRILPVPKRPKGCPRGDASYRRGVSDYRTVDKYQVSDGETGVSDHRTGGCPTIGQGVSDDRTHNNTKNKTDNKTETRQSAPAAAPARSRRRNPATPLPPDFTVTSDMRQWFTEKCPLLHFEYAHEKFMDWAKSSPNAVKSNWEATWRNLMRSFQEEAAREKERLAAYERRRNGTGQTAEQERQAEREKTQRLAEKPKMPPVPEKDVERIRTVTRDAQRKAGLPTEGQAFRTACEIRWIEECRADGKLTQQAAEYLIFVRIGTGAAHPDGAVNVPTPAPAVPSAG